VDNRRVVVEHDGMPLSFPQQTIRAALGAARVVASADGKFDDHERSLLAAAARALSYEGDVDALEAASPAEVAAVVTDEQTRTRIVQALILVAMMDGEVKPEEHAVISTYAKALGVDEPRLANLHQLAHGHTKLVYFDLWRRSKYLEDSARKAWQDKGLKGLWSYFGSITGIAHDEKVAAKYRALGDLPEGTFGRAYFDHMKERNFSFPGEHKGFPEELVKHDLAHVVGGYDTDAAGECEVIAFISGFNKSDPFSYLFMIVVHMQMGVNIFDGSPVEKLAMPADRVVAALARGARMTKDLYDPSWTFWDDFPLPLDDVRKKYGVA
jgi:tellurite resistance protein